MEATELLQAILDSPTQHGIIVTDVEGNIRLWNQGAARIFQYSDNEAIGRNARILFYLPLRHRGHRLPNRRKPSPLVA